MAESEDIYERAYRRFQHVMEVGYQEIRGSGVQGFRRSGGNKRNVSLQGRHQFASLRAPEGPPDWLDEEACRQSGALSLVQI